MESYLSHQHPQSYVSVHPIPPVPCRTSGTVLWNPTCPTNTLNPMYPSILSHLSHVGQVGQSYGILPVSPSPSILCVHPIPLVPSRTSGTVLWNTTCPTIGQVGQSYGILVVPPIPSILCVHPIPPVPCRTSGTVLWNPTCPTNTLNPMCLFVLSHLSHVGQVGQSYGILPVPSTPSILCVCLSYPTCPM